MNIVFFLNDKLDKRSGVGKKITSQINAFTQLSNNIYTIKNSDIQAARIVNDNLLIQERYLPHSTLVRYRFQGILKYMLSLDIDLVYIRYTHFASPSFLWFLRKLKAHSIKIVLEFPTYPYDQEYENLKFISKCKLSLDRAFRGFLHSYVDLCVSFTDSHNEIFGIKVVKLSNAIGADLASTNLAKLKCLHFETKTKKVLTFTAVASMYKWHGYDRFIHAIHYYLSNNKNKNINIKFNIVGDGPELSNLKTLVRELNIADHVEFHGFLSEPELGQVLLKSDIGVDSLARFRSGNNNNNSLKSKEYFAYGLPVVKSHVDTSIDKFRIHFNVSNNEGPIDLASIVEWFLNNKNKFEREEIASLALRYLTWEVQMQKLMKRVNDI